MFWHISTNRSLILCIPISQTLLQILFLLKEDHIKRQYFFHWKIEYNWKYWVGENNEGTTHQLKASKFFATTLRHNWLKATTMKKIQRVLSKEFHWLLIDYMNQHVANIHLNDNISTINYMIYIVIITHKYLFLCKSRQNYACLFAKWDHSNIKLRNVSSIIMLKI